MSSTPIPMRGSDRATSLPHAFVRDEMRPGIITCAPQTDLASVARVMATNHVHAVVVSGIEPVSGGERLGWGLLTALDLVAAVLPGCTALEAGDLASTEIVTVDVGEPLQRAAQLMFEHQLTHLWSWTAPNRSASSRPSTSPAASPGAGHDRPCQSPRAYARGGDGSEPLRRSMSREANSRSRSSDCSSGGSDGDCSPCVWSVIARNVSAAAATRSSRVSSAPTISRGVSV
jgi:hypothetical protein